MNLIVEKDVKINEKFDKRTKSIPLVSKTKMAKDIMLHLKRKQKIAMIKKLLADGMITINQEKEYINKITKEYKLSKDNVETLTEVLFETEDCSLSSVFSNGTIKYCLNQYGMKEYYNDLTTALENFVLVSI